MHTSESIFVKASAVAAIVGGLLWDAKMIYESSSNRPSPQDLTDTLIFVVPLLLLAGLAGLYVRCIGRLGEEQNLSLAGFVVASFGLAVASTYSGLWTLGLVSDVLAGLWGGLFFVALGLVMVGGSIVQAGLLGSRKAVPLSAGIVGFLAVATPPWNLLGVTTWALFGLTWVVLGCVLWVDGGETVQPHASAN
jgi:hypothetical protein